MCGPGSPPEARRLCRVPRGPATPTPSRDRNRCPRRTRQSGICPRRSAWEPACCRSPCPNRAHGSRSRRLRSTPRSTPPSLRVRTCRRTRTESTNRKRGPAGRIPPGTCASSDRPAATDRARARESVPSSQACSCRSGANAGARSNLAGAWGRNRPAWCGSPTGLHESRSGRETRYCGRGLRSCGSAVEGRFAECSSSRGSTSPNRPHGRGSPGVGTRWRAPGSPWRRPTPLPSPSRPAGTSCGSWRFSSSSYRIKRATIRSVPFWGDSQNYWDERWERRFPNPRVGGTGKSPPIPAPPQLWQSLQACSRSTIRWSAAVEPWALWHWPQSRSTCGACWWLSTNVALL